MTPVFISCEYGVIGKADGGRRGDSLDATDEVDFARRLAVEF